MLNALPGTSLISLAAVVLDTETTGLDTATARLVQVAVVPLNQGQPAPEQAYSTLVNPGTSIPDEAQRIHHISDQDLVAAPSTSQVLASIEDRLRGAVVIGHNIGYDLKVITAEFKRTGGHWSKPCSLDTALLARAVYPTLPDYSLDTLCTALHIDLRERHNALADAAATAELFVRLVPALSRLGIRTLAQAEAICRKFSDHPSTAEETGHLAERHRQFVYARVDSFPFRHRVHELMSAPVVIADAQADATHLSALLTKHDVSSVVIAPSEPGAAHGIVTERDLMRLLRTAVGSPPRAGQIMSSPLETIHRDRFVYQAIARMSRLGLRHLAVHDANSDIVGMLSSGDLLRQRARDALILGDALDDADNVPQLAAIWARLPLVARSMLAESVSARNVAAIVAEEMTALTRRAVYLAVQEMHHRGRGTAPVPYSVLILGSGGRGETTLAPDQDNAIVYHSRASADVEKWFAEMGEICNEYLDTAGLDYCRGGVMIKNPAWRADVDTWKKRIYGWITHADTADLWYVDIFYDFRMVSGELSICEDLREYAFDIASRSPGFLRSLAVMATDFRVPIGMFGRIETDHGRVDLKRHGLLPIVGAARILALRHKCVEQTTEQRLSAVRDLGVVNREDVDNLLRAHRIFLYEILSQQLSDIDAGIPASNKVAVKPLSDHRRDRLKWALKHVAAVSSLVGDPMAFG